MFIDQPTAAYIDISDEHKDRYALRAEQWLDANDSQLVGQFPCMRVVE